MRGSGDIWSFTWTGATSWPLGQQWRDSFSPVLFFFTASLQGQDTQSQGGPSAVSAEHVSSPASRAGSSAVSYNVCGPIAAKNNEPWMASVSQIFTFEPWRWDNKLQVITQQAADSLGQSCMTRQHTYGQHLAVPLSRCVSFKKLL